MGVEEKDNDFNVVGLRQDQIEKYKKEIWNILNDKSHVSSNILTEKDVVNGEYEGKHIIAINVPKAHHSEKPIYLTNNPFGNTYKRNYEGDYRCTDQEVRRMIADSDEKTPRDSRILTNYSLNDIDNTSLKQYRQLFASSYPGHVWLELDDLQLLTKLGGYRTNRRTGEEGFTLAGLLMFGKYDSIIDEECAPNFFPDFRENFSDNSDIRWTDRIYPDGTWESNLFQFFRRIYPKLTSILPKPFQLDGAQRIDIPPTHIAVREAFVNTLIHCDYSADGNIVIEQKPTGFTFSNPGTLLISREQFYIGGESVCRNSSLQKMFLMIGGAEKAGSGSNKILKGWEIEKWRNPYINEKVKPDRVILKMQMINLFPDEVITHITNTTGKSIQNLNKDELTALSLCCTEGEITNESLQNVIYQHSADITKMLRLLCNENFLTAKGIGRGTKYYLYTQPTINNENKTEENYNHSNKKKVSIEEIEKIICNLIKNDYQTIEFIASNLDRSVTYLRNNILPRLIDRGSVERQYPETPKHPQQKFRATSKIYNNSDS